MSASPLPTDLSDYPLWRLIVLLDDLERQRGASSPDARRVARLIAERLGIVTEVSDVRGVSHAAS